MAEPVLSSIVQTIFQPIASLAQQKLELAAGVPDQLQKLKCTLSIIKSVLRDAEEQNAGDHAVKEWLAQLKDAVYDADDVLDEYEAADNMQQQLETLGSPLEKVCNCFSHPNQILFRFQMGEKIKEIRDKINEIAKNKADFTIKEPNPSDHAILSRNLRRETHSYVSPLNVIGRDNDKEKLIKMLMVSSAHENVSVIPIVGIGGLGKTTLAQLVFNDIKVDSYFDIKLWVYVSEDFNERRIMESILKKMAENDYSILDKDMLQQLVRGRLKAKRYLLVLDDVWSEDREKWLGLKELLVDCSQGSKIIVTTRVKHVASMMSTVSPYNLQGLPDEDCLSLLLKWAFDERQEEQYPSLVEIGRDIVKKCGGLPLAARTLGKLLYGKKEEHEWLSVQNSDIWKLGQGENDILPALRLTYDPMPPELKQCFAFCSLFPKGELIDKETLIHLWMAQGFLQPSHETQQPENVGNGYFNELLSRSLLEVPGDGDDGEITNCRMHDLVHDLAQSVTGRECLMMNAPNKLFSERVRHVSVYQSSPSEIVKNAFQIVAVKGKKLRTLFAPRLGGPTSKPLLENLISTLQCLRILHLSESEFVELPSSIGDLLHLRYLDISHNGHIIKLPDSVCKLRNLQKLKLYNCVLLETLPKGIWKLISLRHLEITTRQMYLPNEGIEGLTSLRSLAIHKCPQLSALVDGYFTTLQVLRLCDCPKLNSLNFNFSSLSSLETLEIRNCSELDLVEKEQVKEAAEDNSTLSLLIGGLNCLRFNFSNMSKGKEVVKEERERDEEKVKGQKGFQKLRSLTIAGLPKLLFLPSELQNAAASLQSLSVIDCERLNALPEKLGNFTSLRELQITNCPQLSFQQEREAREAEKGHKGFRKLRRLILARLPNLVALPKELQEATTSLQTLSISNCKRLSNLPESLGSFTSLRELKIIDCPELSVFPKGKEQLEEEEEEETENVKPGFQRIQSLINQEEVEETENGKQGLQRLHSLILEGLPKLFALPREFRAAAKNMQILSITDCKRLSALPERLANFTSLREMKIKDCPRFSFPLEAVEHEKEEEKDQHGLQLLQSLTIAGLPNLVSLPNEFHKAASRLQNLFISNCQRLYTLSGSLGKFTSLRELKIENCPELSLLPERNKHEENKGEKGQQGLGNLQSVTISGLPKLVALPEELQLAATSLQYLCISDCPRLATLPDWFVNLSSLRELKLINCNEFSPPSTVEEQEDEKRGQRGLQRLQSLIISKLPNLVVLPKVLQNSTTSLTYLNISDCKSLSTLITKRKRKEFHRLSSAVWGTGSQSSSTLPDGREYFKSLRVAKITNCPQLDSLPEWVLLRIVEPLPLK